VVRFPTGAGDLSLYPNVLTANVVHLSSYLKRTGGSSAVV